MLLLLLTRLGIVRGIIASTAVVAAISVSVPIILTLILRQGRTLAVRIIIK